MWKTCTVCHAVRCIEMLSNITYITTIRIGTVVHGKSLNYEISTLNTPLSCISVMGRSCNSSSDCGNMAEIECSTDYNGDSWCVCLTNFMPEEDTCIPETVHACESGMMWSGVNAACVEGTSCIAE